MKKLKISRRKFIGRLGVGTAGLAAAFAATPAAPVESRPRKSSLPASGSRRAQPHARVRGPAGALWPRHPFPRDQWESLGLLPGNSRVKIVDVV